MADGDKIRIDQVCFIIHGINLEVSRAGYTFIGSGIIIHEITFLASGSFNGQRNPIRIFTKCIAIGIAEHDIKTGWSEIIVCKLQIAFFLISCQFKTIRFDGNVRIGAGHFLYALHHYGKIVGTIDSGKIAINSHGFVLHSVHLILLSRARIGNIDLSLANCHIVISVRFRKSSFKLEIVTQMQTF